MRQWFSCSMRPRSRSAAVAARQPAYGRTSSASSRRIGNLLMVDCRLAGCVRAVDPRQRLAAATRCNVAVPAALVHRSTRETAAMGFMGASVMRHRASAAATGPAMVRGRLGVPASRLCRGGAPSALAHLRGGEPEQGRHPARAGDRKAALQQVGLRAARLRFRQAGATLGVKPPGARLHPGQVRQRRRAADALLCAGRIAGRMHLLLPAAARSRHAGCGRQRHVARPADRQLHRRRPPARRAGMGPGLARPGFRVGPQRDRGPDRQARQGRCSRRKSWLARCAARAWKG